MAKKPETTKKDPRLIAKGQIVWVSERQKEDVVRNVIVVLQLANGESKSFVVGEDEIEVVDPPEIPTVEDLPKEVPLEDDKEEGE